MFALTLHVGVEERQVTFATAPEHVAFAAQRDRGVDRAFELAAGAREDAKLGVGGRAVHEARVAEEVGGAPEEFHTRGGLLFLQIRDEGAHALLKLGERGVGFVDDVGVVEAVVGRADLGDELESGVGFVLGALNGIGGIEPGHRAGRRAERIAAVATEAVPVGDGITQPAFERAAGDDAVGVVVAERERIGRIGAFVGDAADVGEVGFGAGGEFSGHGSLGGKSELFNHGEHGGHGEEELGCLCISLRELRVLRG